MNLIRSTVFDSNKLISSHDVMTSSKQPVKPVCC